MKWTLLLFVAVCAAVSFSACGSPAHFGGAVSIAFASSPASVLPAGAQSMISAIVTNDSGKGVDWTVTCGSADCGSFSPTHTPSSSVTTFTAPATVPSGNTVTIIATATADTSATVKVTVTITSTAPISVTFLQAPPASLGAGASVTLSATVSNDSANAGVDWSVSCGSVDCGSFAPTHTASGVTTNYTAPAAIPTGTAVTITASASSDTSKSATATVAITAPAISIVFTQAPPASLAVQVQAIISATVSNDVANQGVDWTVTCGGADCGSFNPAHTASGAPTTYTAPATVPAGSTVTIVATATADPTKSVSATVTITAGGAISVTFTKAPPVALPTGTQAMISATVANDSANRGVDWSVTCGSADCGSFNPAHTASGATTTYTAPATVPTGNVVTVTAVATADPTKSVSAAVTISVAAGAGLLNGSYAFFFTGNDANGFFAVAGSMTADGNGKITAGEEDFSDTSFVSLGDTLSGTYIIAPDGRGTLTLQVSDTAVGVNGVQTLSFAAITSQHAFVMEFDGSATSNGTLELQNPANFSSSSVTGGYSFTLTGLDLNGSPAVAGGVFTGDGAGKFINGTEDFNDSGVVTSGPLAGTYTPPDAFGRGTAVLGTGSFIYYIVDAGNVKFAETDLVGLMAGSAYTQGSGAFSNASLSGSFVFTATGATAAAGVLAAGGLFTADGNGGLTSGTVDVNNFGTVSNGTLTGSYSISSNGRGTLTLAGGTGGLTQFALYLTATRGALLLELDAPFFTSGTAFTQNASISAATVAGGYAVNFDAASLSTFTEEDLVGQVLADGVSALSGNADINQFTAATPPISVLTPNAALTGTFGASSNGRFTGTLAFSPTAALNVVYYVASGSSVLFIGLDATQVTVGSMLAQQF